MKKTLLLIVALLLILTACGSDTSSKEPETNNDNTATEDSSGIPDQPEPETPAPSQSNEIVLGQPFDIGDYTITIQSFTVGHDYEDKPALIFTYDWTNNSEETISPMMTYSATAFQDGVETGDVFIVEEADLASALEDVRPGVTVTGLQDYVGIDDMDKPLEFEFDEFISFDSTPLIFVIENLNDL